MWAVTVSIKFQNKLAKEAILSALKNKSTDMFEGGGLLLRCFVNLTDTSVDIYHIFKDKNYVEKKRSEWTNQFWQDIKEMGGSVSRVEGNCEVEYSPVINLENFSKIE
jgi:hypothetical protein|tara:strand:+ start:180 stop:503 length:324 start_codon:yes stop_codon:yes gene_type:complete